MRIVDVPGDGDCFLHAVFRGAREAGLCVGGVSEGAFVVTARQALARRPDVRRAYTSAYGTIRAADAATAKLLLDAQPDWFAAAFRTSAGADAFADACVRNVATPGRWFGQLDVAAFTRAVAPCFELRVESVHRGRGEADVLRAYPEGPPPGVVVVVNMHDVHFKYLGPARTRCAPQPETTYLWIAAALLLVALVYVFVARPHKRRTL